MLCADKGVPVMVMFSGRASSTHECALETISLKHRIHAIYKLQDEMSTDRRYYYGRREVMIHFMAGQD